MTIITADIESYWDKDFTLRKLSTEAYVRDPRFEILGCGVKIDDQPAVWVPQEQLHLLSRLPWDKATMLCHNTFFDGFALAHHLGIHPRMYLDTMSMARGKGHLRAGLEYLGPALALTRRKSASPDFKGQRWADMSPELRSQVASYCLDDVEATRELLDRLKTDFPLDEIRSIDQTIRMYTEPRIIIDPEPLEAHLVYLQHLREEALDSLPGENREAKLKLLRSNPQFANALRVMGIDPPTKINKKGDPTFAFAKTDPGLLALLDHPDPRVRAFTEVRIGVKSSIDETRCKKLIDASTRGPFPIMLLPSGALATHRYAGADGLNAQNMPKKVKGTKTTHPIRLSLTAPPGHVIGAPDSSQIEARMCAWLAGQDNVVEAFREGRDVYSEAASAFYGRPVDRKGNPEDEIPGFVGKVATLSMQYGVGFVKAALTFLGGALGGPPLVFREEEARALSVSLAWFTSQGYLLRKAQEAQPATLSEGEWLLHCAVCERIVARYRENNQRILDLWDDAGRALDAIIAGDEMTFAKGLVKTCEKGLLLPEGVIIYYQGLRRRQEGRRVEYEYTGRKAGRVQQVKIYGSMVVENLSQCLSGMIIRRQMLRIGERYPVLFQVHDEIPVLLPEDNAPEAMEWTLTQMRVPPPWAPDLPLEAEGSFGRSYGDAK